MTTLRTLRPSRAAVLLVAGALLLAACDDDGNGTMSKGIDTLGDDFVRAFSQDRNDVPLDASALTLTLTPGIEPFDP